MWTLILPWLYHSCSAKHLSHLPATIHHDVIKLCLARDDFASLGFAGGWVANQSQTWLLEPQALTQGLSQLTCKGFTMIEEVPLCGCCLRKLVKVVKIFRYTATNHQNQSSELPQQPAHHPPSGHGDTHPGDHCKRGSQAGADRAMQCSSS